MVQAVQFSLPFSLLGDAAFLVRDHPFIVLTAIALVASVGLVLAIISWARRR